MYKYYDWKNEIKTNELNEVIQILKNEGIVIFPTETVYGIGGIATSNKAIDRIYQCKCRPREKAINIMVSSIAEIEKYAVITSDLEKRIIEQFMPGPLTIILKKKEKFGENFTLEDGTIGVRIPNNKIAKSILENLKMPLIVPSANISNKPSGTNPKEIIKDFANSVDAIIDGGIIQDAQASTIVKVENNEIHILREGKITIEEIKGY